jgi:membrane protein implicated in regulation of membrane protease activity
MMEWWIWLVVGLVFTGLELLAPGGFFTIFFGVAAVTVGVMTGLGIGGPDWLQWLLFSLFSVVALTLFRNPLLAWMRRNEHTLPVDSLAGEAATALEDIAPEAVGRAELRGATWTARNGGRVPLVRGQRCLVERVDGLTIWIRAE